MPIAISRAELDRIKRWTETDREEPDVTRRRELLKHMEETSAAMTKSWPNSLENVNKRNEEVRQARAAAAERANSEFYRRYLRRQQYEQRRLMYSARDTVFKNRDAPKQLLSAVIETCVQKERQEQVKFQAEQRRLQAEQKRQADDDVIRRAQEWHQLTALKAKRRVEANKQHQRDLLDQAHEIAERKRMEYEAELTMQKIDNIKANQQMEALEEFETNFKRSEKARIRADMEQARAEAAARRAELRARELLEDELLAVLQRSRARLQRRRLLTEREMKEEKRRVLEAISSRLESGDAGRAAHELRVLREAEREKEAVAEARAAAEAARRAEGARSRRRQREAAARAEGERLRDLRTRRHFDIMNRFKNAELYEEFQEKLREEKVRKVKEYREEILRLWRERTEREARERDETREFYGPRAERRLREADGRLLAHAAALVREARERGRPDYALVKAVDRYCRQYRLLPAPPLPRSQRAHFPQYWPRDGAAPPPGYRPPRAPSPPPPEEGEAPASRPRADGLQDPQPTTSKPKEAKKEENVEDYKKIGRANGLQRRPAELDVALPPIAVTPSEKAACTCGTGK